MIQACKVFLAEDHAMFRQGLKALFETDSRMTVVGEASDGNEAVQRLVALDPDVVIIDLSMPGTNGTEAIPKIISRNEHAKVIVLTAHSAPEYVRASLKAGARGYVLKEDSHQDLMSAIDSALSGKIFLSPGICNDMVSRFLATQVDSPPGEQETPATLHWDSLSPREREVLKLTAEGKSNKEMALYLHISVKTVEKHRAQAMKKIDAKGVADVTAFAIREGLVAG
jgi:two-component system, NarL family, response regulator NreC